MNSYKIVITLIPNSTKISGRDRHKLHWFDSQTHFYARTPEVAEVSTQNMQLKFCQHFLLISLYCNKTHKIKQQTVRTMHLQNWQNGKAVRNNLKKATFHNFFEHQETSLIPLILMSDAILTPGSRPQSTLVLWVGPIFLHHKIKTDK